MVTGCMTKTSESRIPCSRKTLELVKAQKRGGMTYDTLLKQMVEQYEPTDPQHELTSEL